MADSQPTGFLLLAVPDTILSIPGHSAQTGLLQLECVTVNVPPGSASAVPSSEPQRDVWLVLKHSASAFELVIPATQTILHSRETQTFLFPIGSAEREVKEVKITLPKATNAGEQEDLDTFEVVLSQYGVLRPMGAIDVKTGGEKGAPSGTLPAGGAPEEYKGRLVLVDEDDGEIVGTLDEDFHLQEDGSLQEPGHEKFPVVIVIPDEASDLPVHVHAVSPDEEEDFLIRSAHMLSRGIIFAATTLASGMNTAASYYVAHSTPNPQPIVFSEASRKNIRTVHKFSGKAVEVSAKTTGLIHSVIDRMVDRVSGSDKKNKEPHPSTAYAPGVYATDSGRSTPIALPPRAPSPFRPVDAKPGSLAPPPPLMSRNADPINHPALTAPAAGHPAFTAPAAGQPPPLPPRPKPRLLNRVLLSTDLLLTAVEKSAYMLVGSATQSVSASLGHKYGKDMRDAASLVGTTAQNVGIVYIDARGVGRRALLRHAGKRMIKGKIGKKEVVLGGGGGGSGAGGVVFTPPVGGEDNGIGSSSGSGAPPGASARSGTMPGSYGASQHPSHPPPQYEPPVASGERKLGYSPYKSKRA